MKRKLSYKGQLPPGNQDRIKLSTLKGKKGYKIVKFQMIGSTPGDSSTGNGEYIGKIYATDQINNVSSSIDFTEGDLLATCFIGSSTNNTQGIGEMTTIFDNKEFNQDIFVYIVDESGGSTPCNYYIELERMDLNDLQATQLTLQSIRNITE